MDFMQTFINNAAATTKERMLELHREAVQENEQSYAQAGFFVETITGCFPTTRKPVMAKRPIASYKPIYVSNLVVDSTHKGRILQGRVVAPLLVMMSIMTYLEDETGAVVKFAVYNALPPGLEGRAKLAAAKAYLKEGTVIALLDPFYKTANDGSRMIRVDDPSDVVFMDDMGKKSAIDLRVEGNDLFKAKCFDQAAELYTRALQVVDEERLLSSVLCNAAYALMQASPDAPHHDLAKVYAAAASTVDPTYDKARLRRKAAFGEDPLAKRSAQPGNDLDVVVAVSGALGNCLDRLLAQPSGQPSSGEASISAADLKARGNERFGVSAFDDAFRFYSLAVAPLDATHSVALILSNRSACHLQLDQPAEALADANAAVCCAPRFSRGYMRQAAALLRMGKLPQARVALEAGLALDPANVPLKDLQKQIADAARADAVSKGQSSDSVIQDRLNKMKHAHNAIPMSERESKKKQDEGGTANATQMSSMNAMFAMLTTMARAQGIPLPMQFCLDERVPPFHTDFSTRGLWPAACDVSACQNRLTDAYENARSTGVDLATWMIKRDLVTSKVMFNRLRSNDPSTLSWYALAEIGSVNVRPQSSTYDPRTLHTYSNAVNSKEMMTRGMCSVSIGFVDLGFLREADFVPQRGAGTTRWVGYEASPYCVAKSIVIATMLQHRAPVDAVLQVWYSAAWSSATLAAFRSAVKCALDEKQFAASTHLDVLALLAHWLKSNVTLHASRHEWTKCITGTLRSIGNFKVAADRHALAAYLLTGQVLDGDVGSVVMFAFPDGYGGHLAFDHSMFHSIGLEKLKEARDETPDIVAAAAHHFRQGISKMIEWVSMGHVTIDLRVCAVEPSDKATLSTIAALDPHTVSWSNVCDYYTPSEFHEMARACSGSNTVHYAYSMNWPTHVKGASIIDYVNPHNGIKDISFLDDLLPEAKKFAGTATTLLGLQKLILIPPVDDTRNILDFTFYTQYHKDWLKAFFLAAGMENWTRQVVLTIPPMYSVLSRTNSTMYFTFSYDPEVNFEVQSK